MILAAGLSPAWQQILQFDAFLPGQVNRARTAHWCASGKVVNVALAAAALGEDAQLVSALGGATGDALQADVALRDVQSEWVHTSAPTRVCTTLLVRGSPATELVENAAAVEPEVLADFVDRVRTYSPHAECTVLTGSLPDGAPPDLFASILHENPGSFLLDLRGEALLQCLPFRPRVVKPNLAELAATLRRPLETDAEIVGALQELLVAGAQATVVSQGADAVWVANGEWIARFFPPAVDVVNPIGSGDCLAAGIAAKLAIGATLADAVKWGIAAASNNAEMLLPGQLSRSRCAELSQQIRVEFWQE